uniref:Uncharacterized protein n=1 Tax=Cannabis sativa TaxID=3483 RepID=A0A803PDT6_CANSA
MDTPPRCCQSQKHFIAVVVKNHTESHFMILFILSSVHVMSQVVFSPLYYFDRRENGAVVQMLVPAMP